MERHSQYSVLNRSGVIVHKCGWLKFMKFFNENFFSCVCIGLIIIFYSLWDIGCEVPTLVGTREFLVSMSV